MGRSVLHTLPACWDTSLWEASMTLAPQTSALNLWLIPSQSVFEKSSPAFPPFAPVALALSSWDRARCGAAWARLMDKVCGRPLPFGTSPGLDT